MELLLEEWLARMEQDYLRDYLPAGGSTLKTLVVSDPATLAATGAALDGLAIRHDLHRCAIDAADTRIHMVESLVHAVARDMDWDGLAYAYLTRLLEADGFALSPDRDRFNVADIAEANSTDEREVRARVRALLHNHLSVDYALSQEFRIAMLRLCQVQLGAGRAEHEEAESIVAWLRGELRLLSALKQARIFQRVGRNNARDIFLSIAHWLRLAGRGGLLLSLDVSRYLQARRGLDDQGGLFYSLNATLDMYEVLRQFIDATGDMESCLVAVLAPPPFLTDDKRGLARYDALKLRIWDDVHDRYRANPLAGLVRLRTGEAALPMEGEAADREAVFAESPLGAAW